MGRTMLYQWYRGEILRCLCKTESYARHIASLDPQLMFWTITCAE